MVGIKASQYWDGLVGRDHLRYKAGLAAGDSLIQATGLVKRYGDLTAVAGIDLDVRAGEAFGFLGPNGAGKSSTMRMLACVSTPSDGSLRIFGLDPVKDSRKIRARLGVCPQQDSLDAELQVAENIVIYARYFRVPYKVAWERTTELLDFMQLTAKAKDQVNTLSGGMKRRLTIARALVTEPDIVLLDEPTTGLDPQARHLVWERLFRLKRQGVTLVLTTHYMDEAEQLCDRIAVVNHGRIVAVGTPRELIERYATREVVELRFGDVPADAMVDKLAGVGDRIEVLPDRLLVYADDGDALVTEVHGKGLMPSSVLTRRASLEDVFLHLTGRTLVD
jgi:lipooligosaccharide transport system ATP-binding protein